MSEWYEVQDSMSMNTPWEKEMKAARRAALEAGKVLVALFGCLNHWEKKGEIDLVTEADIQAEKTILETLTRAFPRDSILSEEAGREARLPERLWIVDPLDGTINFAHGFPVFCISIALEAEGEIVLGLVFNPLTSERFEAARGSGAFLNQKHIRVSLTATMTDSLLATGFPYYVHRDHRRVLHNFGRMVTIAQGIRRPGSAALDLCSVACGRVDGFWEEGLKPWDSAAGAIIVKEAGGRVSTYGGEDHTVYAKSLVASNGLIHDDMLFVLREREDLEMPPSPLS